MSRSNPASPILSELDVLKKAYIAMLELPDGSERLHLQDSMCSIRDRIAFLIDRSEQDVQECFESAVIHIRLARKDAEAEEARRIFNENIRMHNRRL